MGRARQTLFAAGWLVAAGGTAAMAQDAGRTGSAVITMSGDEYTVVIECDEPGRPDRGFRTQSNRATREATGQTNPVNLRLRGWKETDEAVLSLDRFVAWIPKPVSAGPALELEVEMSPNSEVRSSAPVLMTYERWHAGERFEGKRTVSIRAACGPGTAAVPGFRKGPPPDAP